jgi:hypothetical protein
MQRRSIVTALFVVWFVAACDVKWPEAETFRKSLRCGETVEDVKRAAAGAGVPDALRDVTVADGEFVVRRGRRLFLLTFKSSRLVAVRSGHYTGVDGVKYDETMPLCVATPTRR